MDYFDYYLIHAIDQELYSIYNEMDCFNWLIEKKKQGFVKHIGFSYHDSAEFLDQVLTEHPEMEFVQLQMSYLDWESGRKCSHAGVTTLKWRQSMANRSLLWNL